MDLEQIFDKVPLKLSVKKTSFKKLEPEEVFLDTQKDQNQKVETPISKSNFSIFFALIIIVFGCLLVKAGWLQIKQGDSFSAIATKNSTRFIPIFSPRGIIYDKNGKQLVYNIPVFDLAVIPSFLPQEKGEQERIIVKVAGILGKTSAEIKDSIKVNSSSAFDSRIVAENVDRDKVLILEEEIKNLPGFSLERNLQRQYVDGPYFSHLIGYVGRMNESDLNNFPTYFSAETIGKSGLEMEYENVLRTQPGKKEIKVDARGQIQEVGKEQESTNAKGLLLSVDYDLQKHIFDSLENYLKRKGASKASAVAIDPRNGRILALVSLPSFNNNLLIKGISAEDYKKIFDNPDQPLFNRAVSGQYPPGSTIKPFLGAAGLEENIIQPNQIINDNGAIVLPNQYNSNIVYRFPDWKTHGPVDFYSAIAQSCDIYFYYLGGGYGDFKGLGLGKIEKYLRLFGFGDATGIDLPNEKKGFVPTAAWKKEAKGEDWFTGDTYHLSIGQGDLTTTPLRLAVLTAAIANGGMIWQPRIVDKIIDSEKNIITENSPDMSPALRRAISNVEPQGRQIDFISKKNLAIIKQAMRQTVLSGTAQILKDLPVEIAGKTGTAQAGVNNTLNSLFISFAPFKNPEIAIAIMVEGGGEGNSTAASAAKDIYSWYFSNR